MVAKELTILIKEENILVNCSFLGKTVASRSLMAKENDIITLLRSINETHTP